MQSWLWNQQLLLFLTLAFLFVGSVWTSAFVYGTTLFHITCTVLIFCILFVTTSRTTYLIKYPINGATVRLTSQCFCGQISHCFYVPHPSELCMVAIHTRDNNTVSAIRSVVTTVLLTLPWHIPLLLQGIFSKNIGRNRCIKRYCHVRKGGTITSVTKDVVVVHVRRMNTYHKRVDLIR